MVPYGAVKSASLTLRGRLREVLWSSDRDYLINSRIVNGNNPEYLAETVPDVIAEPPIQHIPGIGALPVWCLEICSYDPTEKRRHRRIPGDSIFGNSTRNVGLSLPKGLILTSEDGTTFRRVGLFAFRDVINFPHSRADMEDMAFIEKVEEEKAEFFEGCETRVITII